MALTPKQQRFVEEYLIDLNATQAYMRAGYKVSESVARRNGHRLLTNADVEAAVSKRLDELQEQTGITQERVLNELAKMAFANLEDYVQIQEDGSAYVDLTRLTREQAAALTEIQVDTYTEGRGDAAREVKRVKVKMADKTRNLELLGKHLKLFTDKHEITGADSGPIQITVVPVKVPDAD